MATPLTQRTTRQASQAAPATPAAPRRRRSRSRLGAHANSFPTRRGLGREEEAALVARAAAGDRLALTRLFEAHFPLAVRGALAFSGRGVAEEDLVGEASIGLIEAASRFDPSHGTRFMTYATWWVRRRVVQALARQARVVRVPRHRLGRASSRPLPREVSLSDGEESGGRSVAETLPAAGPTPEGAARRGEAIARLDHALVRLPARQQVVLRARFGLGGDGRRDEPRTLKSIAADLGVSKERVRQIEGEALSALRAALG